MFREQEHLKTLEDKRDRLAERLNSGQWQGDKTKALFEYDALVWSCRVLKDLLSNNSETVKGVTSGRSS